MTLENAVPNLTQPAFDNLSEDDVRLAMASSHALQRLLQRREGEKEITQSLRVHVEGELGDEADLGLPKAVLPLLAAVLHELGQGKGVAIMASDIEVTTQQAAAFLRISRPYFVKLLEAGIIPYRKVGPRRRVLVEDLLAYKAKQEGQRHRGLDDLVAEAQKLGMY